MGSQDLSKLRAGLRRCMEIESTLSSLTDKRASRIRSKGKKSSEIEKLGSFVTDFSTLTVNRLKQILGQNNLPTSGIKKELVARIVENDISVEYGLDNRKIGDLESKLPEMEDRIKALKSQIKNQERIVKPLMKRVKEADSSVKKAKKSWIYFDDREVYIAIAFGLILAFSITAIMSVLDGFDIIDVFDDEDEIQDGFFGMIYSLSLVFSCCIVPFMGGVLISAIPSMFDPVSVALKLQHSAKQELRGASSPLNNSIGELKSLEGQKSRFIENRRDIEKSRKQIEKWEVEIEDLDREISDLRVELKENYAKISHLLPYSYMLE